ncbi:unnamed protein product, partial [Linum tenue]
MADQASKASVGQNPAPPVPPRVRPPPDYVAFRKRKVEDFKGDRSTDPMEVEQWLAKVTR